MEGLYALYDFKLILKGGSFLRQIAKPLQDLLVADMQQLSNTF